MIEASGSNRVSYWDNAKGILICLVVFGHFLYAYQDNLSVYTIVSMIYFFHMPAFILISGYFSKDGKSTTARSIGKLAVAYIIFNTAMMIYAITVDRSLLTLIQPYNSFWYLLALIVWRLTIKSLAKIRGIFAVSVIAALLIGFWSEISNIFALSRVICFFPFFLIGYKLSVDKVNTFIANRTREDYLKGILLLVFSLGSAYMFSFFFYPDMDVYLMSPYTSPEFIARRIIIFAVASLVTAGLAFIVPQKTIPLLSKWGRNSLAIYVIHRIITLIFVRIFPAADFTGIYILFASIACAATLFVLGQDVVSRTINKVLNKIMNYLSDATDKIPAHSRNIFRYVLILVMIIVLSLPLITTAFAAKDQSNPASEPVIYPVLSDIQAADIQNAVSIAFAGDLILLQDQVRTAFSDQTGEYDFSPEFAYASRYLAEADLAIGVFEGPAAGGETGYSTGNYYDGASVSLNFPDSFAAAIKAAGIDFVSTANNHLLDRGEAGAMRTLDVLDTAGLLHTGSYRNEDEKNTVQTLTVDGLTIAVLSYTYGVNNYEEEYFLHENTDITSILVDPDSEYFDEVKASIISDFNRVKESNPDVILVMPHMGTQFSHETDRYQAAWNDIFAAAGADLILGDHSHAVQPVEFLTAADEEGTQRQVLVVNCNGNFVNSYTKDDGDATAITEIYLDPVTGSIICAGVIPMWTESPVDGSYRALPIYDILTDTDLRKQISTYEMNRVREVQATVTSVVLGAALTLDQARERYYLFPEGYIREPADALEITNEMTGTQLYKLISCSSSVCFVGDSITAGSLNGGYGWYEPLAEAFPDITVSLEAWGSATTRTLLSNSAAISAHGSDVYVIAIGTNDVRYRDEKTCAMDADSYTANINLFVDEIKTANPEAQFVFISPWLALDNDPFTAVPNEERDALLAEYGYALENYCNKNSFMYIDPNPAIYFVLTKKITSDYMVDHIHPNAGQGISLYSRSVMEYGNT